MKKLLVYTIALLLMACETETYETGQGEYSLMMADFTELNINGQKQGVSFVTDEGEQYTLTAPATASWIQRPDTTYRAILYYNKVEKGKAEKVAMGQMGVIRPVEHWRFKEQPQDPLGVESTWLTRNGKYINLGLLLKNGRVDDEEGMHALALCQDTVLLNANNTRTAYYRLLHSQGDAPQYYTNRRYVSILIPQERPDSVCLSIATYQGTLQRRIPLAVK